MKHAVIFDLDGLLIDSELISYKLYQRLLNIYGQSMSIDEYSHEYSGKSAKANMDALIAKYGLPFSAKEGLEKIAVWEGEYFHKGVPLKKGAKALLAYLREKNFKILLASSSTQERAINALTQNNICNYFDGMIFRADVEHGKPHPDIFLAAARYAGISPRHCLVLEDSEAGIEAAHRAGMDVICIPDMKKPAEPFASMASAVLNSLDTVILRLKQQKIS